MRDPMHVTVPMAILKDGHEHKNKPRTSAVTGNHLKHFPPTRTANEQASLRFCPSFSPLSVLNCSTIRSILITNCSAIL